MISLGLRSRFGGGRVLGVFVPVLTENKKIKLEYRMKYFEPMSLTDEMSINNTDNIIMLQVAACCSTWRT